MGFIFDRHDNGRINFRLCLFIALIVCFLILTVFSDQQKISFYAGTAGKSIKNVKEDIKNTKKNIDNALEGIGILAEFRSGASVCPLPFGVISWHYITGSNIVRMKVQSDRVNSVLDELKKRNDVIFVEISGRGSFKCNTEITKGNSQFFCSVQQNKSSLSQSDWYRRINGDKLAQMALKPGALVAVLDTGIDFENSEFVSRIYVNQGETAGDLEDNDNNGYTDDISGWNFGNDNNDTQDQNGHGTEVSSIIMALSPYCHILPVKINRGLNDFFDTADLVEGIYYALSLGADVINLSLTAEPDMESVVEAVRSARDAGAVVVAAAGNNCSMVAFPASMDETIAVGSLYEDQPASFSPAGPELDLVTPGVAVDCITIGGCLTGASGTSFSCAMITGICAVLRGMNKHLKADTIKQFLFNGAEDLGPPGRDTVFGEGVINGDKIFQLAVPDLQLPYKPFYAFSRSFSIPISFHLPPSDTSCFVFIGILASDNTLLWLDQYNQWHNAEYDLLSFIAGPCLLSQSIDGDLFGDQGVFPQYDPLGLDPGLYKWAIAVTDESGTLIGPVTYDYMLLY